MENLDGDLTPMTQVIGESHGSHAAGPQLMNEAKATRKGRGETSGRGGQLTSLVMLRPDELQVV